MGILNSMGPEAGLMSGSTPNTETGIMSGIDPNTATKGLDPSKILTALNNRGGTRQDDGTVTPNVPSLNPVQQVGLHGLVSFLQGGTGPANATRATAQPRQMTAPNPAQQQPMAPTPPIQGAQMPIGGSTMQAPTGTWDAWRQQGNEAVQGVNRMPYVFSGYNSMPTDQTALMQMFYPGWKPPGAEEAPKPQGGMGAMDYSGLSQAGAF